MAQRFKPKISNRRLYPRYDFRAGVAIKSDHPNVMTWDTGISQNLSQSGIYVLHSKILVPEEPVYIRIPLFSRSETIVLRGFVSWVGIDDLFEDSPYWVMAGIKFEELKSPQLKTLAGALEDRNPEEGANYRRTSNKIDFVM